MIISADAEGPRAVPARSASPKEQVPDNPNVRVVIHPLRTGTVRAPLRELFLSNHAGQFVLAKW